MTTHTHNGLARAADQTAGDKLLTDWREAVANEIAAMEAASNQAGPPAANDTNLDCAYRAAIERVRHLACEAWALPVSHPAGLRLRAEIARHSLWADHNGEGVRRFEAVLAGKPMGDQLAFGEFDERAVAELVKAVLWTASAAPGERPRMPKLTDKELDDLYSFADHVENAVRDLRLMLNMRFHAYRLAAFDADGGNEAALKQEAIAEARGEASSSTLANVQATIARLKDQYGKSKAGEDLSTSEDDDALEALGTQISNPPSSEDVAALALIARWIGETGDGPMPRPLQWGRLHEERMACDRSGPAGGGTRPP